MENEALDTAGQFAPPPVDMPMDGSHVEMSYEQFVKDEQANSPYFNKMPSGTYNVKFLGAEMVNTKFGVTPRYRFLVDGKEKQLDSKAKSLYALSGRTGQHMQIVKTLSADGKNAWLVR